MHPSANELVALRAQRARVRRTNHKKADVMKHPEVFHHVGLLFNGFSAVADYPLSSLPISAQRLSTPEIFVAAMTAKPA